MTSLSHRARAAALVFVLAAAMFLAAGLTVTGAPAQQPSPVALLGGASVTQVASGSDPTAAIEALQGRLRRLPADDTAWSSLGAAYVQHARLTGDPTFYGKADGAFERSLDERPAGNDTALTGLASLASARHDFTGALRYARQAQELNPYSATNQGVLTDALVELGRYDEAWDELQRMVDLKPSVPSFTRVSYSFELRGDPKQARKALERALEVASTPSDISYALHYLGELAWNSGDVDAAAERYVEGLRHDPSYVPLIAGMAKVAAARGEIEAALARYAEVVSRRPEPSYVIAYADLLASLGREEEAEQQYAVVAATQRLFESQGVNVDLELAVYEADHGRSESALAIAEAEWERRRSVHTEDAYAWALHVGGRHREALDHAKAAAALGTHSASFAYHRGMIEQSLGMDGAAEASLRRALETNPHFSPLQAPRAEAALRQLEQSS